MSSSNALSEGDLRHSHSVSATSRDTNSSSVLSASTATVHDTFPVVRTAGGSLVHGISSIERRALDERYDPYAD